MVDMGELAEVFSLQQKGGKRMTGIATGWAVDVSGLQMRLRNYQIEVKSLEELLTNPRKKLDCWGRSCRERRLDKLTGQLIPLLRLRVNYPDMV